MENNTFISYSNILYSKENENNLSKLIDSNFMDYSKLYRKLI